MSMIGIGIGNQSTAQMKKEYPGCTHIFLLLCILHVSKVVLKVNIVISDGEMVVGKSRTNTCKNPEPALQRETEAARISNRQEMRTI